MISVVFRWKVVTDPVHAELIWGANISTCRDMLLRFQASGGKCREMSPTFARFPRAANVAKTVATSLLRARNRLGVASQPPNPAGSSQSRILKQKVDVVSVQLFTRGAEERTELN